MKTPHPRFFDEVLDAIATLKDSKGTPARRVIEKVERDLSKKSSYKNPAAQIQKALKFGVDQGLITEHGGNFKLGLNNKEYRLFKDFKRLSGSGRYRELKKRGGRGRKRRRRRGSRRQRKGSSDEAGDSDVELSDKISISDSYVPEDRSRRRRRRKRKQGRGRRHAEKTASNESIKSDKSNEPSPKSSKESNKSEKDPKNIDRKNEGGDNHDEKHPNPDTNQVPEPTQDHAYCGSRGCARRRDDTSRCFNNCQENCNCHR